jgi:hypothetical protein
MFLGGFLGDCLDPEDNGAKETSTEDEDSVACDDVDVVLS